MLHRLVRLRAYSTEGNVQRPGHAQACDIGAISGRYQANIGLAGRVWPLSD